MSTLAERMRYVERVRREIAADDARQTPTTPEARKRVVEVLCLQADMPLPTWDRAPRRRPEPIDVAPIKAAWNAIQRDRAARYEARGLSLENHGSRARCRRCRKIVMDVPHGLVGVTPTALYVMHAQQTGCQ